MMILKITKFNKYDQKKFLPDTRYSIEFQGKTLYRTIMMYWYRWGEYVFDIRAVRKAFGKEMDNLNDTELNVDPKIRFENAADEIVNLVGDTPFLEIFHNPEIYQ